MTDPELVRVAACRMGHTECIARLPWWRSRIRRRCGWHESLGFELIGTLREVGRKFDRWVDTRWYQLRLKP